ncbi:MAG: hypothetical protein ACQ9MH_04950 [Nitrospinales bacterium]
MKEESIRNRNISVLFALSICLALIFVSGLVSAHEFSGYVAGEARVFANDALHSGQEDHSASFALQPEYYHEFEGGSSFTFVPFLRVDSADNKRTHFDVRELTFLWYEEDFELRMGVRKVFWGQTEILHLVDIINQTDLVENIDFEDKLGQPMINLSIARDWGTLDFFLLPWFRERTFPGVGGRLRFPFVIDTDNPIYESSMEEKHIDGAIRYSHSIGDWDIGISHFIGTSREPTFVPGIDSDGNPVIFPFYQQINQTSLDLLYASGNWLWKMEALYRIGQTPGDFFAGTGGFEYTFSNAFNSGIDLGALMEVMYDERDAQALTPFEHDIGLGLRVALNDVDGTEFLMGFVQDLTKNSNSMFAEASRRIGDNIKITMEMRLLLEQASEDLFFPLRDDDLFQLEVQYFF